jgi:hypothetical protein
MYAGREAWGLSLQSNAQLGAKRSGEIALAFLRKQAHQHKKRDINLDVQQKDVFKINVMVP